MVLENSGAPVQEGSGGSVRAYPIPTSDLPEPVVTRAQPPSASAESSHHPSGETTVDPGPGNVVPMEVAQ